MIRPRAVLGQGPVAADLALRRVLRFKEACGPLVVLDWIGRGAPLLTPESEGRLSKRPVVWCDLANRRQPVAFFKVERSARFQQVFTRLFRGWRDLAGIPLSDDVIAWAADVAFKVSEGGPVALGALYRAVARPEVARWFTTAPIDRAEHQQVTHLIAWALRFPSVYTCSEGPTRLSLSTLLRGARTVWIEAPVEHFEALEHRLLTCMVDAALWDALWSMRSLVDPRKPETVPTVLHLFPVTPPPDLSDQLRETAGWVRHIGAFQLSADRPPDAATRAWLTSGADVWVAGEVGKLTAAAHDSWLPDEADRKRLAGMRLGHLWVRSGTTGRAVVVNVKRDTPIIPAAWRYRLYAARRRRVSAARQLSTAAEVLTAGPEGSADLYRRLCDGALLRAAWLKVSSAPRDSHGVDGVTIAAFRANHQAEVERLCEDLTMHRYHCQPLRRVFIPKSDGQRRPLGLACIRDRVVQTACLSLLDPIFEPTFSHASFAFRARRNAHQAIALARSLITSGKAWAVVADIERCFDRIDHDVLLDLISRHVSDPLLVALIRQWLAADVLEFRDLLPAEVGVPQGDPLSPLLANVYLDPLDRHFEAKGIDFVRYADDIVAFVSGEAEAIATLRVLADYLQDPLRLTLKAGKTDYVAVEQGVEFLGFRLSAGAIRIQPGKPERVLSSLRALLAVLGGPSSTFLERSEALRDVNALVRGFRNYFALPDELEIDRQMRDLDTRVEDLAGELLLADLRDDPAWICRERFAAANLDEMAEGEARRPRLGAHSAYPEERGPLRPAAWMTRPDESASPPPPERPVVVPGQLSDREDAREESPGVVEHGGRLYVLAHGSYVTVDGDAVVVKKRRVETYRRPLDEIALIFLQGIATNVSVALALRCAERDIPLVVAPPVGSRVAVLSPLDSTRAHLRGRQVLRRNDPDVVTAGIRMLAAKIGNQASVLRYFAKYRRKVDPPAHERLVTSSRGIRNLGVQLQALDPGSAGVRAAAMGFEGRAAALYWGQLTQLAPGELEFRGRATRGATDPVNQAINYVYGMLYGEVWRALVKAGLDPYFGVMHGSERDQGSLVFDLIEEFRAPFADRLVLAMIGRGMRPQTGRHDFLRTRVRRLLAHGFARSWTKKIRWRGMMIAPVTILEHQAGVLVKLFLGQGEYQPFRMRW